MNSRPFPISLPIIMNAIPRGRDLSAHIFPGFASDDLADRHVKVLETTDADDFIS